MKLLICSDIHGDLDSMKDVLSAYEKENAEKILILGDLLYHGPRNDLPKTYAPKAVIELLNANKEIIMSVRGNCDTEVDQMVLNFPILADYAYIELDGLYLDTRRVELANEKYILVVATEKFDTVRVFEKNLGGEKWLT